MDVAGIAATMLGESSEAPVMITTCSFTFDFLRRHDPVQVLGSVTACHPLSLLFRRLPVGLLSRAYSPDRERANRSDQHPDNRQVKAACRHAVAQPCADRNRSEDGDARKQRCADATG